MFIELQTFLDNKGILVPLSNIIVNIDKITSILSYKDTFLYTITFDGGSALVNGEFLLETLKDRIIKRKS